MNQVAANDASARGSQERRGRHRHGNGSREDEDGANRPPSHVDGRARTTPDRGLATGRAPSSHQHVLAQGDSLVLGGARPPGDQQRPPGEDERERKRIVRQPEEHGDDRHHDDGDGPQDGASGARGDQTGHKRQDEAAHPRHEGRAGVDRHRGRQRQQILPRAEGPEHHDLQGLPRGQEAKERLGAQRGRAAAQEVGHHEAQHGRERIPPPVGRGPGNRQAAGHSGTGGDGPDSPAEDGFEGRDGPGEEEGENQEGPDRQLRPVRRETLRDGQQARTRRLVARPPGARGGTGGGAGAGGGGRGCVRARAGRDGRRRCGLGLRVDPLRARLGINAAGHASPPATMMRGRSSRRAQSRRTPRPRSRLVRPSAPPIRMMETGTSMGASRAR